MKKSKFIAAALATTMFATAACGLVACDKDAGGLGDQKPVTPTPTGKVCTITFNVGTGETLKGIVSGNTLKTGKDGKLTGVMPEAEKADSTFQGWTLTSGGKTAEITKTTYSSKVFTKDTHVYAVFASNGNGGGGGGENEGVHTITFYVGSNGSLSITPNTMQTTDGKLTNLPAVTANTDWRFDGWFTAETGGNQVELNNSYNSFTVDTPLYAHYTYLGGQHEEPESDGELLVNGQTKLYLTENKSIVAPAEGATATYEYYATSVALNVGDVVTFKIKGTVLAHHATPAEGPRLFDTSTRHGATWNQAAGAFTVKSNSTGVFSIYVRYYDTDAPGSTDNPLNKDHPCWSIEFTDGGVDQLVPGGLYLVGEGFANAGWAPSTECYIDPEEGLTITLSAGNKIKTCHSDDSGTGAVWDMGDNTKYKEVNGTYINFSTLDSGMGNASVTSGTHTYKITFESGMVVFTCLD